MSQRGGQGSTDLSGRKTPVPLSYRLTGCIHASFAAETEDILQRDEGEFRGRILRGANERPMNAVIATSEVGLSVVAFVIGSSRVEPSDRRVVVVGSCVDNLAGGAMRQIHVRALIVETELHDGDSWNLESLAQGMHFRRDVAEVFREKWQATEGLAQF